MTSKGRIVPIEEASQIANRPNARHAEEIFAAPTPSGSSETIPAPPEALRAIAEEGGLQLNRGGEPAAFVHPAEDGTFKLVDATTGDDISTGHTADEAVAAGLKAGFEIDPRVENEYKDASATTDAQPSSPEAARPAESQGGSAPPEGEGASLQAAPESGSAPARERARVSISIPDSPVGVPDLIDFTKEQGGVKLPRKSERTPEHDDISADTEKFYGGKLVGPKGALAIDEMAQMAYDAGLIKDPTPSAYSAALHDNIVNRPKTREAIANERRRLAEEEKAARQQEQSNDTRTSAGGNGTSTGDAPVRDERAIRYADARTAYDLASERQRSAAADLRAATQRYRNKEIGDDEYLVSRRAHDAALADFDKAEAILNKTPEPKPPKLRANENQGDLLANQTEDLSLVGEKGTDFAARQAETDAAAQAKTEADAATDAQQGTLFSRFRRVGQEMKPAESTGFGLTNSHLGAVPGMRPMIDTWTDRVRSLVDVGDSVKRFVKSSGQRDEVAAKFDAANNGAGYVARQARRHVELSGSDAKLPSSELELQQRAATFVRQANGDKAGMLAKLNTIRGKGYDNIIDYAEKHWDSLEKVAEAAKQGTDAAHQEAETSGVNVDYRDNYVKGAYHDPVTQKVVFDETSGGRGTGSSFKKAKVFNDYAEAIAAGFKPRELRLDILTESAVNSTLRVVNRRKWADSLGEIEMPDGQPAVAPAKENGSAPRGYKPVQVSPGNLVNIHEDLAPTVQAMTADSAIPKLLSHGGAFLKHNILVFDVFHGSRFAQMQAAFEAKIPSYHKGLALLEYGDNDLAAAQKHGLITGAEAKWAQENRPKIEGLIQHGLNAGRISDAIYAEAVPMMPGAKQTNNFIFQKLSRGVITQSAVYALDRNAKLHPEWTPEQLNRFTAKEVNTYYRNLGNQGLFKSKTFQDLARALVFAPQWIEGMVRSEARGYGQIGKVATTGSLGNVGKGMATGLVAYFAFSQVVNMLTRGKPTWENDEPGHKMDAWIPDVMQGSNGFFVSPLSVFAETTHDAIKYAERGMEPLDVSSQLMTNKLHPQVRAMRDLFGGKDFFGRPLHGFDRVTQAAADIAPIPLFARTGGYKGGLERQVLATGGIKATVAPSSTSDIYQLANDFKRKAGVKVPDIGEESDYAKLRRALQNGDTDTAREEYTALRKTKPVAKIEDYFKNYAQRPFTGSRATEARFRSTLDRGQMDIYNSALREREELARQYRALRK